MQEEELVFSYCTMIDHELFFIETQYGLPAKMNPNNGNVSYYSPIGYAIEKGDSICDFQTLGKKVYALKISGDGIITFDLEKEQCHYIPLQCTYRPWGNFVAFEQYGLDLYIFPKYENKVCIMNTINNEITEIADYFDGMTELQCACRDGNRIWLLSGNTAVIGCYDFLNGEMQVYELKKKTDNCVRAVLVDGSIYILNRFGILYIWNIDKCIFEEVKLLETEYTDEKLIYGNMIYAGGRLIIFPSLSDDIRILNMSTGRLETYHEYPEDFLYYDKDYMKGWAKYTGICEDNNYYYCAMRRNNYLLKINKQNGTLSWIKPKMPSKRERMKILHTLQEERFKNSFALGERFFCETDINIGSFLEAVPRYNNTVQGACSGKRIFEKVKAGRERTWITESW